MQKIRRAMAEQDRRYKLKGIVELDDAYWGDKDKGKNEEEELLNPGFLWLYLQIPKKSMRAL